MGKWLSIVLLMLTAMRSAAVHFLPSTVADQVMKVLHPEHRNWSDYTVAASWWNPASPTVSATSPNPGSAGETADPATTGSQPVIVTDGRIQFTINPAISSDTTNLASIGSNSSGAVSASGGGLAGTPTLPGTGLTVSNGQQHPTAGKFKSFYASGGRSVVPINRNVQLSSSPYLAKGVEPAALNSKPQEAYAILGLSTSSTPQSATSTDADLHFSLSAATTSLASTFSISGGTLGADPSGIPEPATIGMLAIGTAVLTLRRRRPAAEVHRA